MSSHQLKEITLLDHSEIYKVKKHHHNYFEVVYYISGKGEIIIDGKTYPYSENCLSITVPGNEHEEHSFTKGRLIYIGFSVENDDKLSILQNGVFKCPHNVHVLNLLKEIEFTKSNGDFFIEDVIDGYISTLIRLLGSVIYKAHNQSRKMIEIKEYINENIENKINAEKVASYFNYDYDYLRKLFKQYYQISISDYILKCKLDISLEKLKKTDMSIDDIAKTLSFSSSSHYIKLFKKNYNITPKQFLLNYDKNTKQK